MVDYAAEDGLNILTYLGLTNLTEREREVFREKWKEVYEQRGENPIMATWHLYSEVLPFTCGDRDRGSFLTQGIRDEEFDKRLKETGLVRKFNEGTTLKDIFTASPERFARTN